MTKINGQPTSHDLTILKKEVITILASILTAFGEGNHGHAGIILEPAAYVNMTKRKDFANPVNSGIYPTELAANAATGTRARAEAEHKVLINQFETFEGPTAADGRWGKNNATACRRPPSTTKMLIKCWHHAAAATANSGRWAARQAQGRSTLPPPTSLHDNDANWALASRHHQRPNNACTIPFLQQSKAPLVFPPGKTDISKCQQSAAVCSFSVLPQQSCCSSPYSSPAGALGGFPPPPPCPGRLPP